MFGCLNGFSFELWSIVCLLSKNDFEHNFLGSCLREKSEWSVHARPQTAEHSVHGVSPFSPGFRMRKPFFFCFSIFHI